MSIHNQQSVVDMRKHILANNLKYFGYEIQDEGDLLDKALQILEEYHKQGPLERIGRQIGKHVDGILRALAEIVTIFVCGEQDEYRK